MPRGRDYEINVPRRVKLHAQLPPVVVERLRAMAKRDQITVAELLRKAVEAYLLREAADAMVSSRLVAVEERVARVEEKLATVAPVCPISGAPGTQP